MRRLTVLALAAGVALSACGRDEPQTQIPPSQQRPTPRRAAVDTARPNTTRPDTMRPESIAGRPGTPEAGRAAAQPAAPRAGRSVASGRRLYTVQVAAFTNASAANMWAQRLTRQGFPAWTSMAELGGRTFYRVRVGAVPTVSGARKLGDILTRKYEWPFWVAPISGGEQLPADAVQNTQRLIAGG